MHKQKKLLLARNIFVLVIIIAFGIIILGEKSSVLLIPKAEEKFNDYIETNYQDEISNLNKHPVTYKNAVYSMKLSSKKNKNHYFYLKYSNHKMTDTYQKDYVEGKQLLTTIKNKLEKEIYKKTNINTKITITNTLNNYTEKVQERIINEENLLSLKFYIINTDITINNWKKDEITKEIVNTLNSYINNDINPRSFTITITNAKDITQSIEISNLDEDFIKNTNKEKIISAIIEDRNDKLLKDSKITYKYLN